MARMSVAGCFVAFIIAGCGDTQTSRLAIGTQAIAVQGESTVEDAIFVEGTGDLLYVNLAQGTHMTVVNDEDDPGRDWATRKVLIHIEDGEHRGKTGKLTRWHI